MNEEEKTISLRDVLYVIFKWKRFILVTFGVIIIAGTVFTFLSPPIYQATAKILLKKERPDIILTTEKSDGINRPITNKDIMAEIEIMKSHVILENVVKLLGLDKKSSEKDSIIMAYILLPLRAVKNIYFQVHQKKELTGLEKNIYELSKYLVIEEIKNSDIFEISYQSKDPEMAKKIVNTITEQYIDYRLNLYRTSQAVTFFQKQLSVLEQNLKNSTKALRDFQERGNTLLSGEDKQNLFKNLSEAEAGLKMAEMEEEELNQKIAFLKKEIDKQPSEVVDSGKISGQILDGLKEQLVSLQLKRSDLLQKYTENHPQVVATEREIKSLQDLIQKEESKAVPGGGPSASETKDFLSRELLSTQAQLASTKAKKDSLKEQADYYRNRASNFQAQDFTQKELERKMLADEQAYNIFLEKLKESEVFLELDKMKVMNAQVLQYAETPLTPIKPKKAKNMILTIMLGCIVSFGLVFIKEYFNHGLKNQSDVEKFLKIKVLASIPYKNGEN